MSIKKKRVEQPVPPAPVSVKERIQQMKDARAAADKIGRKPPR